MTAMPPTDGGLHPDDELSAFVDGEPRARRAGRGARRMSPAAQSCRRQVEQLQAVRDIMRQLPLVDPPFGFFERTLRQGPKPRSTASRRLRNGLVLTIVALVAIIGVVLLVHHRPSEVTPDVSQVFHDYGSVVKPVSVQRRDAPRRAGGRTPGLPAGRTSSSGVVEGERGSLRRLHAPAPTSSASRGATGS